MIKISLSGLPGSGVTSLLAEVRKILTLKSRVEIVDPVRGKNPFDESSRSGFISCIYDLTTQINDENSRGIANPNLLLCNRSVLDHWVFWQHEMPQKTRTPQLVEKHELLKHLASYWIPSYDLFYFVRRDFKQIHDSHGPESSSRISTEDLREMESDYPRLAVELGIQLQEIWNNGSMDESAQQLVALITDALPRE